jgi:Ni/Co efflux regulator RcnB
VQFLQLVPGPAVFGERQVGDREPAEEVGRLVPHRGADPGHQRQTHQQQQQQRNWAPQAREQWRQRQYSQRGETPPVQQADRTQNWGEQRERNRSYSDPNRNTTYRNGSNDRNWRGNDRDNRQWDRNWRSNNRYDWQRYRSANRNHYHIGRYYAPYRNYSYRRLSVGFYLASLFFGSNYWINDPYEYRLPEAYGPYRWVRYYDDALLVDIYSGEVVDVIYDFFW